MVSVFVISAGVGLMPKQVQSNWSVSDSLQRWFLMVPYPSSVVSLFLGVVLKEGFDGVRPQSAI